MKKLPFFTLTLCVALLLAACNPQSGANVSSLAQSERVSSTAESAVESETSRPAESASASAASVLASSVVAAVSSKASAAKPKADKGDASSKAAKTASKKSQSGKAAARTSSAKATRKPTESRTLVAYFSCTGNTKAVAEKIAAALDAELYAITPAEPYTDADHDYNDSDSRTTREQNDDTCRPAISGSVNKMESYDTVVLGYPIWWGQAPKILYTFLESYDFSGKTIVPFCTSGGSGIGSSATNLHRSASAANWKSGGRLSAGGDISGWLSKQGLQ